MAAGLRRPVDVLTVQPANVSCLQVQPIRTVALGPDVQSEVGRKQVPMFLHTAVAAVHPLPEQFFLPVPAQTTLRQGRRVGVVLIEALSAGACAPADHAPTAPRPVSVSRRRSYPHLDRRDDPRHLRPTTATAQCVSAARAYGVRSRVHLLVACRPTMAISVPLQRLKGRTAHTVRRECTGTPLGCRSPQTRPLSIIKAYTDRQARPL